jgi:hypothetical protein
MMPPASTSSSVAQLGSVEHLTERVVAFIKDYNRRAAPFRRT